MRKQKNTPEIQEAVAVFISKNGKNGAQALADACGVSGGTVSKWVNGVTKSFESDTWERLHPQIQPYLDAIVKGKIQGTHPESQIAQLSASVASDMKKIYLTSNDLSMLDALKKVSERMKSKAVSLVEDFADMEEEMQKQFVKCAMDKEVCENAKKKENDRLQGGSGLPHGLPKTG